MASQHYVKERCPHCRITKMCCRFCGACTTCGQCRPYRCTHDIPRVYAGTTFSRNALRRALGIEYEIGSFNESLGGTLARFSDNEGNPRLRKDRDSSVRPSEIEWVTRPIAGDDALEVLTYMSDLLNRSKSASIDASCGYHVHVDACKESGSAIRRFLYLYLKLEEEIYMRLCNPARWDRDYCWPLSRLVKERIGNFSPDQLRTMPKAIDFTTFIMKLYGIHAEEEYDLRINRAYWRRLAADRHAFGYERRGNPRYAGLNIHAWYKQGSIEWRMKEMTLKHTCAEDDDLKYWPLFCGWFTHRGLNERIEVLESINTLEEMVGAQMFPKEVAAWVLYKLKNPTPASAPVAEAPRAPRLRAAAPLRAEDVLRGAPYADLYRAQGADPAVNYLMNAAFDVYDPPEQEN